MPPHRRILERAVFIVGPTSAGKSDVALRWALHYGGEIINADAFQLYREFPVLSAQPSADAQASVPHHLFGYFPCKESMDAAHYAIQALEVIGDVVARKRLPIIVGGSGLYLQALMAGLPVLPSISPACRAEVRAMTLEQLVARLRELDPASLTAIDLHNPRRVARRVELCLQTGQPASALLSPIAPPKGLRGVVFTRDREDLHARLETAVAKRLAEGALEEISAARKIAGATARQILGWREITAYLDGMISLEECRERLTAATRQYARRQLTWFRGKSTFPFENLTEMTREQENNIAHKLALSS